MLDITANTTADSYGDFPDLFEEPVLDPLGSCFDSELDPCISHLSAPIRCDEKGPAARVISAEGTDYPARMVDCGANVSIRPSTKGLLNVTAIAPVTIGVAISDVDESKATCTRMGFQPIPRLDIDEVLLHPVLINEHVPEPIDSPQAMVRTGTSHGDRGKHLHEFRIRGFADGKPGLLEFYNNEGELAIRQELQQRNGLFYYGSSHLGTGPTPIATVNRLMAMRARKPPRPHWGPVDRTKQLESETWAIRLGGCGESLLLAMPKHALGLPPSFDCHPFRYIDHKEQAYVRKRPARKKAERMPERAMRFFMDFGFIRASSTDFSRPDPSKDPVITSFDGFNSYLIIVDDHSRKIWIQLFASKDPPLDEINAFLKIYGRKDGGCIRTDQGGELAKCKEFPTLMWDNHRYCMEPTGSDSPSQNGGAETMNDDMAFMVRTLLYGSNLPAPFWSAALLHAAWVHDRWYNRAVGKTPFEAWYGVKPDLSNLKIFGSRVCVKRTGKRRRKLDRHDFTGIFIGYTATDQNIRYIDVNTGVVKE